MKSELLWSFDDDVFTCWIPANHVVVFWALEETFLEQEERVERDQTLVENVLKGHLRIQFCQEGGLRFRVRFCHVVLLLLLLRLLLLLLLTLLVLAVVLLLELW